MIRSFTCRMLALRCTFLWCALIATSLSVLLSGCVTPPQITDSQVLPQEELELVATIKRGKDYALGSRPELAEEQFRRALQLNPKLSSIYNDLGYVLQLQDRLDEASLAYQKALKLEPKNIVARENYARLLFIRSEIDASIQEYLKLLDIYYGLTPEEIKKVTGQDYGLSELRSIHRSLATAYYHSGQYDEALCYSEKTLTAPAKDFSQIGQHARLLLSLGQIGRARIFLRDFVIVWQHQTPGKLMLDYGIALYSNADYNLAKEAFNRALAAKDTDSGDKRDARLLNLLISSHAEPAGLVQQVQQFMNEDPEFCARKSVDTYGYWPPSVVSDVNSFMGKLCRDENESVLSG